MEEEIQSLPPYKIYSDKIIYAATFFGGPLAAGYIIAENYKAFGEKRKYKNTLIITIAFTIILFLVLYLVPDAEKIPNIIIPLIYTGIASMYMKAAQGKQIEAYVAKGGKLHSGWRVVLIALISFLIIVTIPVTLFIIEPKTASVVQPYRGVNHELFYNTSTIDENEVRAIGKNLVLANCLDSTYEMALFIGKRDNTIMISFPFTGPAWESADVVSDLSVIQKDLQSLYPQNKIQILLCDESLNIKKTIK